MNRHQKEIVVESLRENFNASHASFLVEYKGMSVKQIQNLRKELRSKGGKLKVAKARLMKLAANGMPGVEDLSSHFENQVALVFSLNDPIDIIKVLFEQAKDNKTLKVLCGYFESEVKDSSELKMIASLPSREVLLSQLIGVIQAPISKLAIVLKMPILKLILALKEIGEKKK